MALKSRSIVSDDSAVEQVRNFLCGYRLCLDMLNLRRYERTRLRGRPSFDDPCDCEDVLQGSESFWRARMYEVGLLIDGLPNGREKLMLYYHYIQGDSIERISDRLGISRRTGYRLHRRGLALACDRLASMKRSKLVHTG